VDDSKAKAAARANIAARAKAEATVCCGVRSFLHLTHHKVRDGWGTRFVWMAEERQRQKQIPRLTALRPDFSGMAKTKVKGKVKGKARAKAIEAGGFTGW
jgi:hypothetical protein